MRSTDYPAALLDEVDREAQVWVLRFAADKANGADLEAFKQWVGEDRARADAFARACRVWDTIGPAATGPAVLRDHARVAPRPHMARRAFIGGALAASTAAATYVAVRPPLGLWPSVSELAADYRTAIGEQRNIALAGGSSIDMNTRTSIALRTTDDRIERVELLAGEAAITARDLHRVEVRAGDARAVAEGATFNIRFAGPAVRTSCIAGEVQVATGGRAVQLRAGQEVVCAAGDLGAVTSIDPATVTAWQTGVLVFHGTPLSDVVDEINRYRPGRIVVTNTTLGRKLFSARFAIANVDGVVEQIQQVFGATVTNLPAGVVLLG